MSEFTEDIQAALEGRFDDELAARRAARRTPEQDDLEAISQADPLLGTVLRVLPLNAPLRAHRSLAPFFNNPDGNTAA